MTDNTKTPPSTPPVPQGWQAAPQDEIDLRELVLVLWRQKVVIILMTLVFALAGIAYALLAPQVWTSRAEVSVATIDQTKGLRLKVEQLLNSSGNVDVAAFGQESLYQSYISEFNAMNTKRAFLTEEGIFEEEAKLHNVADRRAERVLMKTLAEGIAAKPADKDSQDMVLSFSAATAELAKSRLEKYINFVQERQTSKKNSELQAVWHNRAQTLQQQYESARKDTLLMREDSIRRTQYSLRISQAAGAEHPLENMDSQDAFNIQLGSKGLAEKLRILEEIKNPEVINPELAKIRSLLASLQLLDMNNIDFTSFQMLESPDEPVSRDKPKRPLIVVLATLLGGMLGVAIVLVRHAFRRPDEA
ncbi:LPS O-antigen chain length determinant protein WzzB [Aeromonas enteropelogenes]|uniref:LPS O-antigen chain length determinant protein WzzB n=1 Tax=Aeromonas TaxID=642 RepID=UPI001CBDCFC7|nr:Wzz/FepE/Etk N-terminal domain-containing protein [Aeromonas enteropelogenes]UAK73524.1 O-antigen chain length regulator [Aeromonas enteropelogenes]